jgi:hypothetical protein
MQPKYAPPSLGSRQVEALVMSLHDIAPEHEIAFMGRVKHLNRLGFPRGISAGRGTPIKYDADQLFQVLAAFELAQLGASPQRAVQLLEECWSRVRNIIPRVWRRIELRDQGTVKDDEAIFWKVPAEAFRSFARANRGYSPDEIDIIESITRDEILKSISWGSPLDWRFSFLHADKWADFVITHMIRESFLTRARMADFIGAMPVDFPSLEPAS